MLVRTCLFAALALLACGPKSPMTPTASDTAASEGSSGTATGDGTTTAPATTSTTSPTTTIDPSTGAVTSSGSDSDATATFIAPSDFSCAAVDGQRCVRCDTWTQDCPPSDKCSPWSSDGDDVWDSHTCAPLHPDPDHAGDPCTVEGSPFLGKDSCDLESMCWAVDPETLQGTCVPFCDGAPDDPACPPGTDCLIAFDGTLNLCLPACNPLLQDCADDQLCISAHLGDPAFVCFPQRPGPGQLHAPCDRLDACAPGLACLDPALALECDPQAAIGCCLPFCDTTMPDCPGAMQQCQSWFEGDPPPPGLESVGFCGIPL